MIGPWLQDRHAIVTGGGSGIGEAIADALATQGAQITLVGRNEETLKKTGARLGAHWQQADVSDEQQVYEAFEEARLTHGPVSILVNNAGTAQTAPFGKTSSEMWRRMFDVNTHGAFHCCQAALPDLLTQANSRIINVASTAARKGYAYVSAYVAAKHAVLGLTRALAVEFAGKDLTVNAVCPGFTDTNLVETSIEKIIQATGRTREQALEELTRHNPQGRLIQPGEVAQTVLWLCQDSSRSVTGQAIAVAGGEIN